VAQRRLRRAEPEAETELGGGWESRPAGALIITGTLVALVLLAGVGLDAALRPAAGGALARCHPAAKQAPRVYSDAPPMCIDPTRHYPPEIPTPQGTISVVPLPASTPPTVNNLVVLAPDGVFTRLSLARP